VGDWYAGCTGLRPTCSTGKRGHRPGVCAMRLIAILPLLPLVLVACSDADSVSVSGGPGPASGAGGGAGGSVGSGGSDGASQPGNPLSFPDDDDFDEDATPDDALSTVITAPTQLVAEGGTIAAITADDRLVYTTP